MKVKFYALLIPFFLFPFFISAQTVLDKVVDLKQTIQTDPLRVELSWNNPGVAADYILFRRDKDAAVWYVLFQEAGSLATGFVDTEVELGKTYEYGIQRLVNGIYAFGYLTIPVEAQVVDSRGTMLVFVEQALENPLAADLDRLRRDLIGDGWKIKWYPIANRASVETVKNQIVTDYLADSLSVKSVLLFGEIPVPYSGNAAWDGHGDHDGAWPADSYYGDIQSEAWTDISVNNTNPGRAENDNVPGDKKFDQSFTPTPLELSVGRVDFSNLNETTFGTTRVELYRRYLDKNHRWRSKQYVVNQKALVDDNFGYFGGEAFAADGYRNGNAMVGSSNVMSGDFFNDTDDKSYLLGYGCGGGNYTGAGGVGNSGQFANDSVNLVFSMLFGSYFGDWDFASNPFMPSALASRGGILTCGWAGRPDWFVHGLGAGETIGYCALATQNSCDNTGYYGNFGNCGAHTALLGDPSLRAQIVAPPTDLSLRQNCENLEVTWTAADQPGVIGYLLYRSDDLNGTFVKITPNPVADTHFTDTQPIVGDVFYMVKSLVLEQTPSGRFFNTSTGIIAQVNFAEPVHPTVTSGPPRVLTCARPTGTLGGFCPPNHHCWVITENGDSLALPVTFTTAGRFLYVAQDLVTGCRGSDSLFFVENFNPPADLTAFVGGVQCNEGTVLLNGNSSTAGAEYSWRGPGNFSSNVQNPFVSENGDYVLTVTDPENGCVDSVAINVDVDFNVPDAVASGGDLSCSVDSVQLFANSNTPSVTFTWIGPDNFFSELQNPFVFSPGIYELTVRAPNGCEKTVMTTVNFAGELPVADPQAGGAITCKVPEIQVTLNPDQNGYTFDWTGPEGFQSTDQDPLVSKGGLYTVRITNPLNGCSIIYEIEVPENTSLPTIDLPDVHISCLGAIELLIPPGICGQTNIICLLNGQPVDQALELQEEGTYTFTTTDTLTGCESSDSFFVDLDSIVVDLSVSGQLDLSCKGDSTTLVASSTTPGVFFEWSGGQIFEPANPVQNLRAGGYLVHARTAEGCETSMSVIISEPDLLHVDLIFEADCQGLQVLVTPFGGTPPYTWTITPSLPLPPSTAYTIEVTDSRRCKTIKTGVTGPFLLLNSTVNSINETVAGAGDGAASVVVTGGTAPYEILWSNGDTTATISNLIPGDYGVTVTDAGGCTTIQTFTILPGVSATQDLPGLENLRLSPNPTSGIFDLVLEFSEVQEAKATILDVSGRVLSEPFLIRSASPAWRFDMSGQPAGIYICKITTRGKSANLRVIKTN